jgi:diaminobutyrate-2-oxoglutarate transaminase
MAEALHSLQQEFSDHVLAIRQLGMLAGVQLPNSEFADRLQRNCFNRGLIVEFVGPEHDVMKLLPALTISPGEMAAAMGILREAMQDSVLSLG